MYARPEVDDLLNEHAIEEGNAGSEEENNGSDNIEEVGQFEIVSTMGGNSLVHHNSDYMVPSQLTQQEKSNNESETSDNEPVAAQGKDAKSDFLPIFETLCKFANAAGPEGRHVLDQELNALKDEQLASIAKKKKAISGKDTYGEYMHLFETVCGYTNDVGEEGRWALMVGLNRLKRKQVDIITLQKGASTGGMVSMPATSTKTIDKKSNLDAVQRRNSRLSG